MVLPEDFGDEFRGSQCFGSQLANSRMPPPSTFKLWVYPFQGFQSTKLRSTSAPQLLYKRRANLTYIMSSRSEMGILGKDRICDLGRKSPNQLTRHEANNRTVALHRTPQ